MTDSWTDDEVPIDEVRRAFEEGTKGRTGRTLADEDPVEDKPRLRELLVEGPPLQFYPQHSPEVQRDIERRERLRAEELEHLTALRDRVQQGIDDGAVDLYSGTEMLLNISKARMALAGVGYYPGAW